MHIPIKDASLEYSRYAENLEKVGFLKNVKFPDINKFQGAAAKTCIAFSLIGVATLTANTLHNNSKLETELTSSQRTSSGKVIPVGKNSFTKNNAANGIVIDKEAEAKQESITLSLNATSKIQKKLSKIGGFELPEELKKNNYPKAIAELQLNKGEYYLALVSLAEGFSSKIVPDNKGYFIGFGWNLTLNSIEENEKIAKKIGMPNEHVRIVKNMSHQSQEKVSVKEINSVTITPQQGMQAAYLLGEKIREEKVIPGIQRVLMKHRQQNEEDSHKKAIETFNSLNRYEQDLLVYHGYKAGNQFLKFKNLVLKVVDYAENRETLNKKEIHTAKNDIVSELNYSFQLKGKKILDKRAQEITGAMFYGPSHFAEKMNLKIDEEKKITPPLKISSLKL